MQNFDWFEIIDVSISVRICGLLGFMSLLLVVFITMTGRHIESQGVYVHKMAGITDFFLAVWMLCSFFVKIGLMAGYIHPFLSFSCITMLLGAIAFSILNGRIVEPNKYNSRYITILGLSAPCVIFVDILSVIQII
ncbi:MAG: hypothetical protein Q8Q90_01685 [bacterium]|nr:hypothetical protein [bacterium]